MRGTRVRRQRPARFRSGAEGGRTPTV